MPNPNTYIAQAQQSEQAESSSINPIASGIRMRTLVELQVISQLLSQALDSQEDLRQMRQDIALSMRTE